MTRATLLALTLLLVPASWSQQLIQDWSQPTKTFDTEDPGTIDISITGVNPFLYAYATEWSSQDQALSDFNNIVNFIPKNVAQGAAANCATMVAQVQTDIHDNLAPKAKESIPLADTQKAWTTSVEAHYAALINDAQCQNADGVKPLREGHDRLFPPSGISSVTATVTGTKSCKTYTVTIHEFYQGSATGKTITSTVPISCEELTLSAGTLLTEIQNLTYNSRPSPKQSGQFLSIEGGGTFRPTVVGLLNYNLPRFANGTWVDPFRIGISSGPVFQNSQSGASAFGIFLGGSISVYKRLYLSIGEHWGEFADTPFGLTNGAAIPAGFGQLTPRLRHTARLGIGITFRTNDISKAFAGGTSVATATAKPK